MNPRIVHEQFPRKGAQQRQQRPAEIAESDHGQRLAVQEKRIVVVALELLADPERRISVGYAMNQMHFGLAGDPRTAALLAAVDAAVG